MLEFEYEHLKGYRSVCWLVTHSGIRYEESPTINMVPRTVNFPLSDPPSGYTFTAKPLGTLAEAASAQPKMKEEKKHIIQRLEKAGT